MFSVYRGAKDKASSRRDAEAAEGKASGVGLGGEPPEFGEAVLGGLFQQGLTEGGQVDFFG